MDPIERGRELIHRYLDGIAADSELKELERLLAGDPEVARLFVQATRLQNAVESQFREEEAAHVILADLKSKSRKAPVVLIRSRWALAAAAALLLAAGLWIWSPWAAGVSMRVVAGSVRIDGHRIIAWPGQAGAVELAGRGRIHVYENTELKVRKDREAGGIIMDMTRGMAAFEIERKKEEPVRVATAFAEIEVTGTKFDVDLDPEKLSVTVYEGSVAVKNTGGAARVRAYEKAVVRAGSPPQVKPAGRIAFASRREGNYEIYTMDPDGSEIRRLTQNPATDRTPAWSPDGKRVAFVSDRDGNQEIYVMDTAGLNARRLTNHAADDTEPAWSPDGTKLAFVSRRDGNSEIYVMKVDGSSAESLTFDGSEDRQPSWSPDGKTLAFVSDRDGRPGIFLMRANGSGLKRLTDPGMASHSPRWSPDGTKLAWIAVPDSGGSHLCTMNPDGTDLKRLTADDTHDLFPSWSPDGSKIVFMSNRRGHPGDDLFLMNKDGTNIRRLTDHPASDTTPAWSPVRFPSLMKD